MTIYPNSVVCGEITIGDYVTIGANSFVAHDVESGMTVAGVPAKVISTKK